LAVWGVSCTAEGQHWLTMGAHWKTGASNFAIGRSERKRKEQNKGTKGALLRFFNLSRRVHYNSQGRDRSSQGGIENNVTGAEMR